MNSEPHFELPRLLYIGDVPVESSYHGSALLYRLLERYPPDRLMIVESGLLGSAEDRRLKGATYVRQPDSFARLSTSRFNQWHNVLQVVVSGRFNPELRRRISAFAPDAVLTVAHGASWIGAAKLAESFDLPLHLVCHDDWPSLAPFPTALRKLLDRCFCRVYRQSRTRLCVSPEMVDAYAVRYGVAGTVLYPSRAAGSVRFNGFPRVSRRRLTVAFAGSQFLQEDLRLMASALSEFGGELLLFGPFTPGDLLQRDGWTPNVSLCGMLDSNRMIEELRQRADILFVPISFDVRAWQFSTYSFPSKLADYTQAALPLLIFGPECSSSIAWARANENVAICVTEKTREALVKALRILEPAEARRRLGEAAQSAGEKYFSHEAAERVFMRALVSRNVAD